MRALIADDQPSTARALALRLESEGIGTEIAEDGGDAVELLKLYEFDIAIVDRDMRDDGGSVIVRAARRANVKTPIVITGYGRGYEPLVEALNAGADAYIDKPYHIDEVLAVVLAVVRRSQGHASNVLTIGAIEIDVEAKAARAFGEPLHLTGKEYAVLELLALRQGQTVTKEGILLGIYNGRDNEPELKIIDVFVCKIRHKLGDAGRQIRTTWGVGFRLDTEPGPESKGPRVDLDVAVPRVPQKIQVLDVLNLGEVGSSAWRHHLPEIKWPSLSAVLAVLKADKLITATVAGGRTGRTLYQITDAGREYLRGRQGIAA